MFPLSPCSIVSSLLLFYKKLRLGSFKEEKDDALKKEVLKSSNSISEFLGLTENDMLESVGKMFEERMVVLTLGSATWFLGWFLLLVVSCFEGAAVEGPGAARNGRKDQKELVEKQELSVRRTGRPESFSQRVLDQRE